MATDPDVHFGKRFGNRLSGSWHTSCYFSETMKLRTYLCMLTACCILGCKSGQSTSGVPSDATVDRSVEAGLNDDRPTRDGAGLTPDGVSPDIVSPDSAPPLGTGFAAAPSNWSVPDHPFVSSGYGQWSHQSWAVFDIDGDGKTDLISHADSSDDVWGLNSTPHWKVYKNTGGGFAGAATNWSAPAHPYYADGYNRPTQEYARWTTFDIDGDKRPDLVSHADSSGDVWGLNTSPHWKVYKNTGTGFAASASTWPVPTHPFYADGYDRAEGTYGAIVLVSAYWTTLDMDGDSRPDLVSLVDSSGDVWGLNGTPHWKIYKNTGAGFATTSADWPVPTHPHYPDGFDHVRRREYWSTVDIDGDKRPDLISYADSNQNVWGRNGSPHWKVYKNTGTGFAVNATTWPVPAHPYHSKGFYRPTADGWTFMDINGDHMPDLVIHAAKDGAVWGRDGIPQWKVYLNTGSGFASASNTWTVPFHPFYSDGYDALSHGSWQTADLNGDDRPDLISLRAPNQAIWGNGSNPHWKVYLNQ